MLNIGKLGADGADYYLDAVASGAEDYYTGAGEAPGYWTGQAAAGLGLAGRVAPDELTGVLAGLHPQTGERLGRSARRRVPGFDLALRAPKSVSVAWALGDETTAATIRDAHDQAVAAALDYMEANAGYARRGRNGAERIPVEGLVAAAFRHRVSRAGDPLLHSHVLVANLGRSQDGQWRTLDGRGVYAHGKTAGYLYQAALREQLSRRLGVEWGPIANGTAELAAVPREVVEAFSQRRAEITAHMAERGAHSAKAAQAATLETRSPKDRTASPESLRAQWAERGAELDFDTDRVAAALGRTHPRPPSADELTAVAEHLAGPEGLTAHASTFTRRDVVRAWCEALPASAGPDLVEQLADRFLDPTTGTAVQLTGDDEHAAGGEVRYSTPELVALETRLLDRATSRRDAGAAVADEETVQAAVAARPSISDEQAAMVQRLTTSGDGVEVVVGKAGAGKTFALDAARAAWQADGVPVVGAALAARAAAELHSGAGIDAYTLDALLAACDRPGSEGVPRGGVVVVDEAAMAGTRTLARLADHAVSVEAKVVLVGDHRQLPAVAAGGVFLALTQRLEPVELGENRRQVQPWQRTALDELRHGDPSAAVAAYHDHGRVVVADTADAARDRLAADWWAAYRHEGPEAGVMIAARRSDVVDLNHRARQRLSDAGGLVGPELAVGDREFQAGDRVMALRNNRRLEVHNGTRATITGIDTDQHALAAVTDDGHELHLPRWYLEGGHLTHGYAVTAHKAQGLTTDQTWVLGSDELYREWGYVALSRGRQDNRIYAVADPQTLGEGHTHSRDEHSRDAVAELTRALAHSRSHTAATDHTAPAAQPTGNEAQGADQRQRLRETLATAPADRTRELAWVAEERDAALDQLHAAQRRHDAAATQQSQSRGRGLSAVLRRGDRGQQALQTAEADVARWQDRLDALDRRHGELETAAEQRQGWLTSHTGDLAQARQLVADDRAALRARVQAVELAPPAYIANSLGSRPEDPTERRSWRTAITEIERYRSLHGIEDMEQPLGELPREPTQRTDYERALDAVRQSRHEREAAFHREPLQHGAVQGLG